MTCSIDGCGLDAKANGYCWGHDKHVHGTMLRGEQIYCAKLTEVQVRDIRRLARVSSHRELAERYNVVPQTIGKVIRRERWRHVA
jgi:hypothetical protein